jgi:hypothetical protein
VSFCPDGQHLERDDICVKDGAKSCADGFVRGESETCGEVCPLGEELNAETNECECQDGLVRIAPTFACVLRPEPKDPESCSSGVQTGKLITGVKTSCSANSHLGKCYTFTFENG